MPKKSKPKAGYSQYMKGKKSAGKRTSPYTGKKKTAKKKYRSSTGMARKTAGLIKTRGKKY